jgi:hypothetical protein
VTPSGEYAVYEERCPTRPPVFPAAKSCSSPWNREVFLAAPRTRMTLWHELGHAFDYWHLSNGERQRFLTLVRRTHWSWTRDTIGRSPLAPELFADLYAICAWKRQWEPRVVNWIYNDWLPDMTGRRVMRACDLIARAR